MVPNKPAARIMERHTDPTSETSLNPVAGFSLYTEDFSRPLSHEEIPIITLCRTRRPFKGWKIGHKSPNGQHFIYNVAGECIYDKKTGEFLGGVVALQDVTEWSEKINSQMAINKQEFELICDTMPQMLW